MNTDTWSNYADAWFTDHCSSCHGSAFNDYGYVSSQSSLLSALISSGTMPPSGASQADRDRIGAWFNCGMPQ